MTGKIKKTIATLSIVFLNVLISFAGTNQQWKDIKVDIKANGTVTTTNALKEIKNGFQQLSITLTNKGNTPITIERISVSIPIKAQLSDNLDMVFGGSCMGRTPLLNQKVGSQTNRSSSNMYEMLRLSDSQYLFAGATSWRIFMPNFTLKQGAFEVWSDGEGKQLKPGQTIEYEQILLRRANNWLELLDQFGTAIASENKITKLKPADFKGWATWDYYGRVFTSKDIYGNMDQLNQLAPEVNMIQIDGGWWTERGDYKTLHSGLLPGGIKEIVNRITAEGKTPGIHFDGFRGDEASEIYQTHPEYFLHDQDGKLIVDVNEKADKVMRYIYFDYSHPGARAHIADCIKNMKDNWGIRYFKVDFMRYGLENDTKLRNKHVKSFKAYDPTITGVERFRLGMKTMREAMGDDIYFLGCSAVFGPTIGFVDGMRTGADIHPTYNAFQASSLGNLSNFYLSGKVFNGDADYLVFREDIDEDEKVSMDKHKSGGKMTINEAQMWADFNKLYGTARLQSDNLMTLRAERKALAKEVFEFPVMEETVPLDFWKHATQKQDGFELIIARKDKDIYLGVFNWGDNPKEYELKAFGKKSPVLLEGRHSQIIKYEGKKSFDELCENMKSL